MKYLRIIDPSAGILADPEEANLPSRRILEKNGFSLVEVRQMLSEAGRLQSSLSARSGRRRVITTTRQHDFANSMSNGAKFTHIWCETPKNNVVIDVRVGSTTSP